MPHRDQLTQPPPRTRRLLAGCDAFRVYSNVSLSQLLLSQPSAAARQLLRAGARWRDTLANAGGPDPDAPPAIRGSMDVGLEPYPPAPAKPLFFTASNTHVVAQAWAAVLAEAGLVEAHDFTVKVDIDTVRER